MQQVNRAAMAAAVFLTPLLSMTVPAKASGVTLPAPAVTLYGKAEVQLAYTDKGLMRYTREGTQLDMPFSRFGLRGEQVLNEHLTAFFTYEVDVRGFDQADTQTPFSARNTFIGIKGQFGQLIAGRNDTRLKTSEGGFDLYNETSGDIAQILPGQDRLGDSLTYLSPSFGNWSLSATYVLGQDNELQAGKDGVAISIGYGDRSLSTVPYYLTLTRAQSLNGLDATRLMWQQQFSGLVLGVLLQHSEESDGERSGTGGYVSAEYRFDHWRPKVQLGRDTTRLRQATAANHYTAGIDYVFNRQSKAYLYVTRLELTDSADTSLALGLQYRF